MLRSARHARVGRALGAIGAAVAAATLLAGASAAEAQEVAVAKGESSGASSAPLEWLRTCPYQDAIALAAVLLGALSIRDPEAFFEAFIVGLVGVACGFACAAQAREFWGASLSVWVECLFGVEAALLAALAARQGFVAVQLLAGAAAGLVAARALVVCQVVQRPLDAQLLAALLPAMGAGAAAAAGRAGAGKLLGPLAGALLVASGTGYLVFSFTDLEASNWFDFSASAAAGAISGPSLPTGLAAGAVVLLLGIRRALRGKRGTRSEGVPSTPTRGSRPRRPRGATGSSQRSPAASIEEPLLEAGQAFSPQPSRSPQDGPARRDSAASAASAAAAAAAAKGQAAYSVFKDIVGTSPKKPELPRPPMPPRRNLGGGQRSSRNNSGD